MLALMLSSPALDPTKEKVTQPSEERERRERRKQVGYGNQLVTCQDFKENLFIAVEAEQRNFDEDF